MMIVTGIQWTVLILVTMTESTHSTESCERSKENDKDTSIFILGAGMAGLSTSQALTDRGFTNFKILEGSSRIGGRIKSEKMGNHSVELGAMWIYGKGTNPVYKMAEESGLSFVESGKVHTATWAVKDERGGNITAESDRVFKEFEDIVNVLDKENYINGDLTVREMLQRLGWKPDEILEAMIEDYFLGFESGISAEDLSAKHLLINAPYDEFNSDDLLPVNDTEGYQSLFNHILSCLPSNLQIQFNKHVTHINQSQNGVVVATRDGTVHRADYVIVTFSLGVLKDKQITFSPPLPPNKVSAIDKFGMSAYGHIYLQFPTVFWEDTSYLVYASEDRTKNRFWFNLNHIHAGCNILQLSVFAEESVRIESLSDSEIINELTGVLQRMYPEVKVPLPTDFKISRWRTDPLFRGAFSYWPSDFTSENMDDLMAPFGRVYFAGEHLSHKQYGFVHSSHTSGIRVAHEILYLMIDDNA